MHRLIMLLSSFRISVIKQKMSMHRCTCFKLVVQDNRTVPGGMCPHCHVLGIFIACSPLSTECPPRPIFTTKLKHFSQQFQLVI